MVIAVELKHKVDYEIELEIEYENMPETELEECIT